MSGASTPADSADSVTGGPRVRVILADDHTLVRAGIRRILESQPEFEVVAEAADGVAALAAIDRYGADVLVLDLSLPGLGGLDLLRRIGLHWPALRVLVFTMHDSAAMVAQCLRLGAAGFITKSSAPELLVEAVRRVARGEVALSPDVAEAAQNAAAPLHAQLSGLPGLKEGGDERGKVVPQLAAPERRLEAAHFRERLVTECIRAYYAR